VIFPGFRTYSAFRQVPRGVTATTFERWEREKQDAEERRLLYVAATRARDRLFLVEGARGRGSVLKESLHAGLSRASDEGAARCEVTGLSGRKRVFVSTGSPDGTGGSLLQVAVSEPLPVAASPPESLPDLSFAISPGISPRPVLREGVAPELPRTVSAASRARDAKGILR
jgi:hypothetical protein